MKKSSLKTTCFLTSIFCVGGAFWNLLGGSWASLGTLWAPKWRPRAMESLREGSCFFTLVILVARLWIFFDLGGFGKGLGGFWEDFWRIFGSFLRFGETHRLCFGTAHRLRFVDSCAAKTSKLQWVPRLGPAECAKRLNPPHPVRMSRRMGRSSQIRYTPRD